MRDRVIVDTPVTVEAEVAGLDGGWVEAIWRPPSRLRHLDPRANPARRPPTDRVSRASPPIRTEPADRRRPPPTDPRYERPDDQ